MNRQTHPQVMTLMAMNMTNQMMMDQGLGSILIRAFCYFLNYFLIESFLVQSQYS